MWNFNFIKYWYCTGRVSTWYYRARMWRDLMNPTWIQLNSVWHVSDANFLDLVTYESFDVSRMMRVVSHSTATSRPWSRCVRTMCRIRGTISRWSFVKRLKIQIPFQCKAICNLLILSAPALHRYFDLKSQDKTDRTLRADRIFAWRALRLRALSAQTVWARLMPRCSPVESLHRSLRLEPV